MNGYGIQGGIGGALMSKPSEYDLGAQTVSEQQGALSRAIEANQRLLHLLHEQISTIENRATAFMRPDSGVRQGGGPAADSPRATGSPVSEMVVAINAQLESAVDRLRVVAQRFDN